MLAFTFILLMYPWPALYFSADEHCFGLQSWQCNTFHKVKQWIFQSPKGKLSSGAAFAPWQTLISSTQISSKPDFQFLYSNARVQSLGSFLSTFRSYCSAIPGLFSKPKIVFFFFKGKIDPIKLQNWRYITEAFNLVQVV